MYCMCICRGSSVVYMMDGRKSNSKIVISYAYRLNIRNIIYLHMDTDTRVFDNHGSNSIRGNQRLVRQVACSRIPNSRPQYLYTHSLCGIIL